MKSLLIALALTMSFTASAASYEETAYYSIAMCAQADVELKNGKRIHADVRDGMFNVFEVTPLITAINTDPKMFINEIIEPMQQMLGMSRRSALVMYSREVCPDDLAKYKYY